MSTTFTTKTRDEIADIAVVGGGAAGLAAAITAAGAGASVILIERNDRCGRKLRITGKGRCNVTNDSTPQELMQNVTSNPKFLYAALNRFSARDTMDFFENEGVPLKVERGKRVFPVSDRATDIVDALVRSAQRAGVRIIRSKVSGFDVADGEVKGVFCDDGNSIQCRAVILCTGGASYPQTGSDGSGFALARSVGHTVTPLVPSLVPLVSRDPDCRRMQGLSLKNVSLTVKERETGKTVFSDFGEMMFTHFGLTGPMVLSASAHIRDIRPGKYAAYIDLKPALDEKKLDARIVSDFEKYRNKDFVNALCDLLPQKMIPVAVERSGIGAEKKVNSVTREERHTLLKVLKSFEIGIDGFRPIAEAIVTKGGVSVSEINPKTMESKICRNLYFAGEIIDVDAYTGGFNLQIAFSTGVLAGESAASKTYYERNV